MANISRRSRYIGTQPIAYRVFDISEISLDAEPVRIDRLFGRRFTSWEVPDDQFLLRLIMVWVLSFVAAKSLGSPLNLAS